MFCPNCGVQMSDNAKFCMKCGASLSEYTMVEPGTGAGTGADTGKVARRAAGIPAGAEPSPDGAPGGPEEPPSDDPLAGVLDEHGDPIEAADTAQAVEPARPASKPGHAAPGADARTPPVARPAKGPAAGSATPGSARGSGPGGREQELFICQACLKGKLVPLGQASTNPVYQCDICGTYFGDFLKKGVELYYNTTHLQVGQLINKELRKGKVRVSIHFDRQAEGISELAAWAARDLRQDLSQVKEAMEYLVEHGVLKTYIEGTPDRDFIWFGVDFPPRVQGPDEVVGPGGPSV